MLDGVLNVVMRDDVRFARVRLVAIRVIVVEMRVRVPKILTTFLPEILITPW